MYYHETYEIFFKLINLQLFNKKKKTREIPKDKFAQSLDFIVPLKYVNVGILCTQHNPHDLLLNPSSAF